MLGGYRVRMADARGLLLPRQFRSIAALRLFAVSTALIFLVANPVASAVTSNQANVLNQGIYYFDTELSCHDVATSSSTANIPLNGKDNLTKSMNFFISKGLNPTQAAAIIGNMEQESGQGLNPTAVNPSSGAYGIAQWLGGRLDKLKTLQSYDTLGVQLNYLWDEVTVGSEKNDGALQALKTDTTLEQMVTDWELHFERAGTAEANIPNRVKYATALLQSYGASTGTTTGTNTTTASSQCDNNSSGSTTTGGTGCGGGTGSGKFVDDNKKAYNYNGLSTQQMCARAKQMTDVNSALFKQWWSTGFGGECAGVGPGSCNTGWCDFTASFIWGYSSSGHNFASHNDNQSIPGSGWHWNDLIARGVGHPNDRHPPVGAFLFYNNHSTYNGSPSGHIVIYLGGNTIVSSDMSSTGVTKDGYVGIVAADKMETYWGLDYLGWADPLT